MRMQVNGVHYNVETAGEGPALLLLHGFTGSTATWRSFLPSWSRRFRVIAVDCLGHGQSDAPLDPARYATEHAVSDLTVLLDQLGVDQAHVLGYSMGGRLALSFAMMRPERLRSLILESSSPGLRTEEERSERMRSDEALAARIERDGVEKFVDYWENIPLFQSMRRLPESVRAALRRQRLANSAHGLAGSLRGMGTGAQPSWWERLSELAMPVQLIVGELDEKFTAIGRRMGELIPDCRLVEVQGAGHAVHVERADFFDTIVMGFLTSIDQERKA
jgi:2-succinyl-6-hydroxy-2,4-cyclohexadiene-1-carboxylate synthase